MQSDKSCPLVEQYLAYLITIKGRSRNTILEYRLDLLQFFRYVASSRNIVDTSFRLQISNLSVQSNLSICIALSHIIRKNFTHRQALDAGRSYQFGSSGSTLKPKPT